MCQSKEFARARRAREYRRSTSMRSFSGTEEEWLERRIKDCLQNKSKKLELTDRGLKLDNESLPSVALLKLTHLEELNLSDNKFTTFPEEIFQLTKLRILRLSRNKLTELPANIHKCQTLEVLMLDNNKITQLSPLIRKLSKLKSLSLENNRLTYLPEELGDLQKLQELTVSQNKIAMFPEDMFRQGSRLRKIFANTNELVVCTGLRRAWRVLNRYSIASYCLRFCSCCSPSPLYSIILCVVIIFFRVSREA